jgi:hypothetical protein
VFVYVVLEKVSASCVHSEYIYVWHLFSVSIAVNCFHEVGFLESTAQHFDEGQEDEIDSGIRGLF